MRAGASGVMCSYNKVNGTYACADAGAIARDLKATMGFRGFVQSDWGATHSALTLTLTLALALTRCAMPSAWSCGGWASSTQEATRSGSPRAP